MMARFWRSELGGRYNNLSTQRPTIWRLTTRTRATGRPWRATELGISAVVSVMFLIYTCGTALIIRPVTTVTATVFYSRLTSQ